LCACQAPGAAAVSVERERAVGSLASVEVEELELVGGLHLRVERVLVDEDAEAAFRLPLGSALPAGAVDLPERPRRQVADENLMRRVAERDLEGAERGL